MTFPTTCVLHAGFMSIVSSYPVKVWDYDWWNVVIFVTICKGVCQWELAWSYKKKIIDDAKKAFQYNEPFHLLFGRFPGIWWSNDHSLNNYSLCYASYKLSLPSANGSTTVKLLLRVLTLQVISALATSQNTIVPKLDFFSTIFEVTNTSRSGVQVSIKWNDFTLWSCFYD